MKVLVLGATGMLGHKLVQNLSQDFLTYGTTRKAAEFYADYPAFENASILGGVDAFDFDSVKTAINTINPDVVINSIGIVKQLPEANDPVFSITINSLFPHQLAKLCSSYNIRLIHYSTDCVFSGRKGYYSEGDFADADDLYGRTKLLGEVTGRNCLTLRTSIIGRELGKPHGLIDWFLAQRGQSVKGYQHAFFSGLTTNMHSEVLKKIITGYPDLEGLYHLAAPAISKYDLLKIVKKVYHMDIGIEPDTNENTNRSLNGSKFQSATKIFIPSWPEMISKMYQDPTPYDSVRR